LVISVSEVIRIISEGTNYNGRYRTNNAEGNQTWMSISIVRAARLPMESRGREGRNLDVGVSHDI
jgi:hypothetical protein